MPKEAEEGATRSPVARLSETLTSAEQGPSLLTPPLLLNLAMRASLPFAVSIIRTQFPFSSEH